jgi:hypothetical protein
MGVESCLKLIVPPPYRVGGFFVRKYSRCLMLLFAIGFVLGASGTWLLVKVLIQRAINRGMD